MKYYQDEWITLYHGDCRDILPDVGPVTHTITDPPYDERTHAGARTARDNGRASPITFPSLAIDLPAHLGQVSALTAQWMVYFCSLEMLGDYARVAGKRWIRAGVWNRPDGTPQRTGDRPAQGAEGIAIMHGPGRKRWNGRGKRGVWTHNVERRERVHPTQKPVSLMIELLKDFALPGDTILDPFAGSGTTLLAARVLGMHAVGIEIDRAYCDAVVNRIVAHPLLREVT